MNDRAEVKRYIRRHVQKMSDNLFIKINKLIIQQRDIIRRDIIREINYQIPIFLNREIMSQIVASLVGNKEIEYTLERYKNEMKREIKNTARKQLDLIVGDEKYHIINKAYFDAFKKDGQLAIAEMKNEVNQVINKFDQELSEIDKLKAEVNSVNSMKNFVILNSLVVDIALIAIGYWCFKNNDEK